MSRLCAAATACFTLFSAVAASGAADPEQVAFFEKNIRPLLAQHCYKCHSAEAKTLRAHLYLDSRQGWQAGGDSGPAIVPGKPDASLLIKAIRYQHEELRMPPERKLPPKAIALLELWVASGAVDPRDQPVARRRRGIDVEAARRIWPYTTPKAHAPPPVRDGSWPRGPIDRFVLAELEAAGLSPARDADRRTWLRRVSYDLTGLPPTPQEIDAFVHDDSPRAPETVVDRLLASPRFGEHWGRHWLDLARYADSNGADFNKPFPRAWRYRNYVIDAFNRDKPYDQFLREQIAGDLMPGGSFKRRAERLVATGYLMLGSKMLSERDKEKLKLDIVDEQLDAVGTATMGMTMGCARCHDHKFAPVSMRDYYALAGIFRSTATIKGEFQQYVSSWVVRDLPVADEHASALKVYGEKYGTLKQQMDEIRKAHEKAKKQVARLKREWIGIVVDDEAARLRGKWRKSTYKPQYVGVGYIHDDQKDKGEKSATFTADLPAAGEYEVRLSYTSGTGRATKVPVRIGHASGESRLTVNQEPRPPIEDMFLPLGRFHFKKGRAASVTIETGGTEGYVIVDAVQFVPVDALAGGGEKIASKSGSGMNEAERREAVALYRELVALEKQLAALEADAPKPAPRAMAVEEDPDAGDIRLCIRGESHNRGPVVPRGFIEVMSDGAARLEQTSQSGRLEFARWLTRADHPLTARVMVNRVWAHLIGEGIVRSVDNFTELGERPTHPQLLDTLAVALVESGWSVKSLVRRIALSRTYAMASDHEEAKFMKDPENRLLWRAHRKRLTAESLRDTVLALSGQMDPTPGGAVFVDDKKPDPAHRKRRSVYLPLQRGSIPTLLRVFDFAETSLVVGKRPNTTVPAQSLALLNNRFFHEAARRIAGDLIRGESDEGRRAARLIERLLGRPADEGEVERILAYVKDAPRRAEGAAAKPEETWARAVHALMASTEFRMLN